MARAPGCRIRLCARRPAQPRGWPSLVDPFKPYLIRRINEGCLKATTLHREISAQGFAGSYAILRKFVEQYRSRPDPTSVRRAPSVRQVTGWICRHPDNLC
jgi:transposase